MANKRKVLKINNEAVLKHLQVIRNHGIIEQGDEKAIQLGRQFFYWQRGNEKFELTNQDVGKLLNK